MDQLEMPNSAMTQQLFSIPRISQVIRDKIERNPDTTIWNVVSSIFGKRSSQLDC
ncbi:hypothetical protein LOAG_17709 [Loa loa]|uniref:Uncharacterized protein n=1 Tax=Loa loa TaxID=7209 RepID=A0A1S0UHQ6_LOALO|nr:hypothetical protein LOAG_17709 [Loa loa]EJD75073.1 hypothetical protein LOAG_17709 [Loa loa]